jgi:hypothetical protein
MAWKLSNLPGGEDFEAASADDPVEQATAAPGEKRNVSHGWISVAIETDAGPDDLIVLLADAGFVAVLADGE